MPGRCHLPQTPVVKAEREGAKSQAGAYSLRHRRATGAPDRALTRRLA